MSFQDFASDGRSAVGSGGLGKSAPTAAAAPDPYSRLCSTIRAELVEYRRHTGAIMRCKDDLGTRRDSKNMRKRMHDHIAEAEALAESLSSSVEALRGASKEAGLSHAERQDRRDVEAELMGLVKEGTAALRDAVEATLERERQCLGAAEAAAASRSRSSSTDGEEEQQLVLEEQDLEEELAFNAAMIDETHEDIERISRNVVEVNSVFQHLAQLVDEQRSDIDTIEGNVMDTEERVRSGLKHVDKAADKQRQARGKMCALLVCLLVTGGVLLLLYKLTSSSGAPASSAGDGQDAEDDSGNTDAVLHSAATAVQAAKSAFRRASRPAR